VNAKDAYVYIFDLWKIDPVYHRVLPKYPKYTYCGRRRGDTQPFPSLHAVKFGRPCKQCYPGGGSDGKP
jgi:hypothetical protein